MSAKDIQQYLEANRGKYPPELLVAELRKTGHAESEIREALRSLNIAGVVLAPGQGIITTWGKVWRLALGFLVGGLISFVLTVAAVYSLIILMSSGIYSPTSFGRSNFIFLLSISLLVALAIPVWLFFRLRAKMPHFAHGVLIGSILITVGLAGFIVFLFVAFGGWL